MANGAFKFKDNSGNVVSFISGSGSNISFSGGTLDLSGMTGLTLGNLTLSGTTQNALSASHAASYLLTSSFNTYSGTTNTLLGTLQTSTSSLNSFTSSATTRLISIEGVSGSYATTGSNLFKGSQTISGSIVPAVTNTYDLGSPTNNFRHLYLSSASLYIDGTKVLGSTAQELQITTDTGQSFKILEAGSDNITLQSADGNIELKSSGGGDVILDSTTGVIALKGTTTLYAGNKILSSDGNAIQIGNSATITGSLIVTGFIETQELRTTYISSSILYRSGSTKFGDELGDTHAFTGSLLVSGTISIPGSGLISGSSQVLNGSGVFSGSAQLPSGIVSSSAQTIANLPSGTVSGSFQVLNGTTIHSGSFFNGISVVSGSAQADVISTTNIASLAMIRSNNFNRLIAIGGTNDGAGTLYVTASINTNAARLRNNDASYGTLDISNTNASGIGIYAVANKHYFSGSVGINKTSPNASLDVNGGAIISGNMNLTGSLTVGNSNVSTTQFNVFTSSVSTQNVMSEFYNNDYTSGTRNFIRVRNAINSGGTMSSYFGQGQDGKTYIISNDFTKNHIVIDGSTTYVGLGTNTPQAKLHVDDGSIVIRTSPTTHSAYNWYSITDSHNTVRIKDNNELYIKKDVAGGSYGAFVLHPQTVGLNFDVTFDLTIGTPSSSYRHIAIAICSDGTNTTSNYDYIVLRHNVSDSSGNQIRIDVAGNTEQSYVGSAIPNFADGTQRRIQIRVRNNFYVIEVDGSVIHSFMATSRTRTSGKVGFSIYESTDANTFMYVRNFKIKDYSSERSVLYGWNTGEGLIGNKTQIRTNNSVTAMGRSYAHFPAPSANGAASIYLKNRRSYTRIQGYIRLRGGGSTDGWANNAASIGNDTFMDGIAITGLDSTGANETWIWGIVCNNYNNVENAANKPSFVGSNYSTFLTNHSVIDGLWLYSNDGAGRSPVRTFYFNRELGSALDGDIRIRIMSDQSPEDNEDVGIEEFGFNLIPSNSNDFGNPENNKKLGEFIPAGTPIQVVAGGTTLTSGPSGTNASLGTGCSGASPAHNCGTEITNIKFTPKRANSLILIQTNNVVVFETSNVADHFYLFASNSTDGNVLVKSGMYLPNFGGVGGANGGIICLNGSFSSWGATQKTISLRLGTTGGPGNYYSWNPYYGSGGFDASTVGNFTYIITEIAQ